MAQATTSGQSPITSPGRTTSGESPGGTDGTPIERTSRVIAIAKIPSVRASTRSFEISFPRSIASDLERGGLK